eukprot:4335351-Prymnesium_polylepis.1
MASSRSWFSHRTPHQMTRRVRNRLGIARDPRGGGSERVKDAPPLACGDASCAALGSVQCKVPPAFASGWHGGQR